VTAQPDSGEKPLPIWSRHGGPSCYTDPPLSEGGFLSFHRDIRKEGPKAIPIRIICHPYSTPLRMERRELLECGPANRWVLCFLRLGFAGMMIVCQMKRMEIPCESHEQSSLKTLCHVVVTSALSFRQGHPGHLSWAVYLRGWHSFEITMCQKCLCVWCVDSVSLHHHISRV
jgi:hypothetical protein